MPVRVEYTCPRCLGRHEAQVASPPPAVRSCPSCGGTARRVWSPIGVHTSRVPPTASVVPQQRARAPLCASNPDVPGLCHLPPEAGRLWLARARKDGRALEKELERIEQAPSPLGSTFSAGHHHGAHHHSHDAPPPDTAPLPSRPEPSGT